MANQWPGLHKNIIKTDRILLRPLTLDYMPGVFKHKSDPKIIHWKEPDTELKQSREWVEKRLASPKSWNFVIHYLPEEWRNKEPDESWLQPSKPDQEKILGICGIFDAPELGYAYCTEVWGKGIATEVVGALVKTYWDIFPNGHPGAAEGERDYLMAITEKSNFASANVLKKNGFQFWKEYEEEMEIDAKGTKKKHLVDMWKLWKPGFDGDKGAPEMESQKTLYHPY